jgi:hypothetical protein
MKSILGVLLIFGASSSVFASEFASDSTQDKAIFDALNNVPARALPTPYPYAGYQKNIGRLYCSHMINTNTSEETYSCTLQPAN